LGLIAELKRRNVIRMALLYCVASWLVLQVADVLFGIMALPDWSLRLVFGILLLGLPVALVLAWVFEVTPEGLRRERSAADGPRLQPETGRRLDLTIVVLLVLALAGLALDRFVPRSAVPQAELPPVAALPEPVVAPAVESGAEAPGRSPTSTGADAPDPRSLAVLPFVNMSGDADNEFFSDGLTEELLNVLAQLDGLRVAARTSSFRFKGASGDMADIGRQLRVAHLLEGSVRRSGERVRITAQLISAADGFHLWSETYDRELTDIFAIQDDISAEVARALRVRLLGDAPPVPVARPPTGDLEAYTAYLRAKQALRTPGYENYEIAAAGFRAALALDPEFAAAHAGLALSWRERSIWGIVPWSEAEPEIRAGVDRALALDDTQPLAWALDGMLRWRDETGGSPSSRMAGAERSLRRALDLEAGQPLASELLANLLRTLERPEEAQRILQAALERDPLSAQAHVRLGTHYSTQGDLEAAAARFIAARALAPDNPTPGSFLARTRLAQGRIGEAIIEMAAAAPLDPRDHEGLLLVAQFYLELDRCDAAAPWIDAAERMAPRHVTTLVHRALWHWRRGETAAAAAIAMAAFESELPNRWGSNEIFGNMLMAHELRQGEYRQSIAILQQQFPGALDPLPEEGEPNDMILWAMLEALPLLRARDGDVAARERARQILDRVEVGIPWMNATAMNFARVTLLAQLGQPDEALALIRENSQGRYGSLEWFWDDVASTLWPVYDTPAVRAFRAEHEGVRKREREWLAASGREPDAEAVIAAMAIDAAAASPDMVAN
jgi:TolB-like protein/Flp pilus assembly protein TadD